MKISVRFCKISLFVEQELQLLPVAGIIENVSHRSLPCLVVLQGQIHAQYIVDDPRIIFQGRIVHRSIIQRNMHGIIYQHVFMVYHTHNHCALVSHLNTRGVVVGLSSLSQYLEFRELLALFWCHYNVDQSSDGYYYS